MAPKIRGVAPPSKRFRRPEFAVKTSPRKKVSKGHKGADISAEKLQNGETVDVRLEEQGLYGSWNRAVIGGVKPGLRQVEFKNLFDKGKPVKEWVRFGDASPGTKQPLGTRKVTDGKPVLRPGGPGLPPAEPSFRKTGGWPKDLWVEVYADEAWWEGVLMEDISASQMDEEDSVVDVVFPHLDNLIEQVTLKNLRECKDWNEKTGVWSIRGRLGKENDPRTTKSSAENAEGHQAALVAGNGRGESGQDEDPSFLQIDYDGIEGPDQVNLKSAAQDDGPQLPSTTRAISTMNGVLSFFGRLMDVEEEENQFLVRVQTLQYALDEIQISVKHGFITLDVTSANIESPVGLFVSKVHNVCCSLLELPTDKGIDFDKISWNLQDEVLTFVVPRSGGNEE
ncbi:unnamed protein product [Calypogeia fissa]